MDELFRHPIIAQMVQEYTQSIAGWEQESMLPSIQEKKMREVKQKNQNYKKIEIELTESEVAVMLKGREVYFEFDGMIIVVKKQPYESKPCVPPRK